MFTEMPKIEMNFNEPGIFLEKLGSGIEKIRRKSFARFMELRKAIQILVVLL